MDETSPFVPGARVALEWAGGYNERFVEKVYKNGNFTLRGSKQQWRPSQMYYSEPKRWRAYETGKNGSYSRDRLLLWDATTDAEIAAKIAEGKRRDRFRDIKHRIERLRHEHTTDAMLDAIEAALPPKPESSS